MQQFSAAQLLADFERDVAFIELSKEPIDGELSRRVNRVDVTDRIREVLP